MENNCESFSVVVVTFNRLELLKECIHQIYKQTNLNKIIVVNNCSTDGTEEYLRNLETNNQIINCKLDENYGGAYGFWKGLKIANEILPENEWIIIIDDDAHLSDDFTEEILCGMKVLGEQIEAYSCKVISQGKIDKSHRKKLVSKYYFKTRNLSEEEYIKDFIDIDLASFCGLIIKNSLISKIGLPQKDFFIWFDDTEYSLRIKSRTKIMNINRAELNHKTSISKPILVTWKAYYGYRNQLKMVKKHYGKMGMFVIYYKMFLSLIKNSILGLVNKDRLYKKHLLKDAIHDYKHNLFGKNSRYLP